MLELFSTLLFLPHRRIFPNSCFQLKLSTIDIEFYKTNCDGVQSNVARVCNITFIFKTKFHLTFI